MKFWEFLDVHYREIKLDKALETPDAKKYHNVISITNNVKIGVTFRFFNKEDFVFTFYQGS